MDEIKHGGTVLARHIRSGQAGKDNLNFFSHDSDYIQAGVWRYDQGKELLAHVHHQVERKVDRTCEVLYIISGEIEATIYTLEHDVVKVLKAQAGDILILLECGHGYRILQDNTQVLEVKNGPYLGADIDRYRI